MKTNSIQPKRRDFLRKAGLAVLCTALPGGEHLRLSTQEAVVQTVQGRMKASEMGLCLIHEHVLVDFVDTTSYDPQRWDREQVIQRVLPYLLEAKSRGCQTLMECTPAYLGRDVRLLEKLSRESGIHILTNTGYYGARDNQHLPEHAFHESAEALAKRWIAEFEQGIEGTSIRPGFMKIGVHPGPLSSLHQKLVKAAALTHHATGLTIASHTGPALPAFEEMKILRKMGVDSSAFVWVHAQNEKNTDKHVEAAQQGAWISLDGVHRDRMDAYMTLLKKMQKQRLLSKVLLSHDAGWYSPGEELGGEFRPYTDLFEFLLLGMRAQNFSEAEIDQILKTNPSQAYAIRKRLL